MSPFRESFDILQSMILINYFLVHSHVVFHLLSRNHYQIAVAGRGMQIVEFTGICEMDRGE